MSSHRFHKRIVFNVSGDIFETFTKTLERFPGTLLGDYEKRHLYYCIFTNQYFFNRSRLSFGSILYFYQSNGILRCPPGVSLDVFEAECKFFQIPDEIISQMKTKEGIIPELQKISRAEPKSHTCVQRLWDILENPETSGAAWLFAIFSLTNIFLSILTPCLETLRCINFASENTKETPWSIIELVLNVWFLIELIARFITSPDKAKFIRSTLNCIDAFVVIPYLFLYFLRDKMTSLAFVRIFRFIRVIRLMRLSKHSRRLKIVGMIIKSCFRDLQYIMYCFVITIILGGSLMYHIEAHHSTGNEFTTIPNCFWWAVQTVTTVGYGDMVPVTYFGKCLSACFMIFGALTTSLPVLSIGIKFHTIYQKMMKVPDDR